MQISDLKIISFFLKLFFAFSEIDFTFVLLIKNLTITEMENIAKFTIGQNTYQIFKNYCNQYGILINGDAVTVHGWASKDDAWELGRGGYLLTFAGIWFQLSENDPRYAYLISKGFAPNTEFIK